jgi:hypothetical protein
MLTFDIDLPAQHLRANGSEFSVREASFKGKKEHPVAVSS